MERLLTYIYGGLTALGILAGAVAYPLAIPLLAVIFIAVGWLSRRMDPRDKQ